MRTIVATLELADPYRLIDDPGLGPITGESSSSITSRPTAGVICMRFEGGLGWRFGKVWIEQATWAAANRENCAMKMRFLAIRTSLGRIEVFRHDSGR